MNASIPFFPSNAQRRCKRGDENDNDVLIWQLWRSYSLLRQLLASSMHNSPRHCNYIHIMAGEDISYVCLLVFACRRLKRRSRQKLITDSSQMSLRQLVQDAKLVLRFRRCSFTGQEIHNMKKRKKSMEER